jgi:hypothetical protein
MTSLKPTHTRVPLLALLLTAVLAPTLSVFAHESQPTSPPSHSERLPAATVLQLELARQAAARFFDINVATAEGYVDIDVVIPHMGRHLLKPRLLNGQFDPTQPQLLVYQENGDGSLRLAAVEYAVPTDLSARAPSGFAGDNDVWFKDTGFQLWTLHAWVYDFNPDGVFAPNNPREP